MQAAKVPHNIQRVVLKIGTSVLTTADSHFSLATVKRLVDEMVPFHSEEKSIIVVSSGAIACGMDTLKLSSRPKTLPELQACAAIGQGKLMRAYEEASSSHGIHTAQMLLTRDTLHDRLRYLNTRNTLQALLEIKVIPIINENDTVSTDEIQFGDNDMLSALIATLVLPDLLVLLTDVPGLMDRERKEHIPKIISVKSLDEMMGNHIFDQEKRFTVGGMQAKWAAIRVALQSGVPVIMADGTKRGVLTSIFNGEECGTLFLPKRSRMGARKRWLAHNAKVKGYLLTDEGAYRAVFEKGKSLLAGGITKVDGRFKAGELVCVKNHKSIEYARGLVNYSSEEVAQIMGKKSEEIRAILKDAYFKEVIHRDNLAILEEEA